MEPEIVTIDLKMAGVQGVIDHDAEFGPALSELWQKLAARMESTADKTNPLKAIGYWQLMDNSTRVYFAGVQVESLENLSGTTNTVLLSGIQDQHSSQYSKRETVKRDQQPAMLFRR
jgi:hypothetical protein